MCTSGTALTCQDVRKVRDELKSTRDVLVVERLRTKRMQQDLDALKTECEAMRAVLEGRLPETVGQSP